MKNKTWKYILIAIIIVSFAGIWSFKKFNFNNNFSIGQKTDSLNGVFVFYNGGVNHISGRNTTADGYNLGLKYQCVEFVKRYYYEYFNHKMPDSYGHAKDFYNKKLTDGQKNIQRNLIQFSNPSISKPQISDLLIFEGTIFNKYGHVAIISKVFDNEIEVIQQNPGPFAKSREIFQLENVNGKWKINNSRILGWLRMNGYDTSPSKAFFPQ